MVKKGTKLPFADNTDVTDKTDNAIHIHRSKILCIGDREIDLNELKPLAETIAAPTVGLLNLITLVKLDTPEGEYEYKVAAGRRRFLALTAILGREYLAEGRDFRILPVGCDIESVSLVENFERKNLTLPEEVEAIRKLMERIGLDEIAKLLGRTKAWVALRANLSKLSPSWKKCMEENSKSGMTAGHYEAIARLPESRQENIWEQYKWNDDVGSLADFKSSIEDDLLRLSGAPFDLKVCKECVNRSQAAEWLFSDLQNPEQDRCLDPECFENRLQAFIEQEKYKIIEANKKGSKIYLITTSWGPMLNGIIPPRLYKRIDNAKKQKTDPNAFNVNDGSYCWIEADEKAIAAECSTAKTNTGTDQQKPGKTMAMRESELLHKRQKLAIEKLIKHLRESKDYVMPTLETMFRMSACLGVNPLEYSMSGLHGFKTVQKMTENKLLVQYWIKILDNVCGNLNQDISGTLDQIRIERAGIICDIVEIVWDDFLADATDEIKEPKGWIALRVAEEKAKKKDTVAESKQSEISIQNKTSKKSSKKKNETETDAGEGKQELKTVFNGREGETIQDPAKITIANDVYVKFRKIEIFGNFSRCYYTYSLGTGGGGSAITGASPSESILNAAKKVLEYVLGEHPEKHLAEHSKLIEQLNDYIAKFNKEQE